MRLMAIKKCARLVELNLVQYPYVHKLTDLLCIFYSNLSFFCVKLSFSSFKQPLLNLHRIIQVCQEKENLDESF